MAKIFSNLGLIALLACCIVFSVSISSCKKSSSDSEASLSGLLKVAPEGKIAKELYTKILEIDKTKPIISQINTIGYVDWKKVVVDISSDASKPIAIVFPVCGRENTSDLLLFQLAADQTVSDVKVLHWSSDVKDKSKIAEKLKQRFL